ncbi:MAG: hypothetical protein MJK14_11920 [Rivularia sp. ALOHA_DT_140]|nr:hypothetical protein [Rivularia sp. ALOHA_DT_140]
MDLAMDINTTRDTTYGLLNAATAFETHFQGFNPITGRTTQVSDATRFLRSVSNGSKSQHAYNTLARKYVSQRARQQVTQSVRAF